MRRARIGVPGRSGKRAGKARETSRPVRHLPATRGSSVRRSHGAAWVARPWTFARSLHSSRGSSHFQTLSALVVLGAAIRPGVGAPTVCQTVPKRPEKACKTLARVLSQLLLGTPDSWTWTCHSQIDWPLKGTHDATRHLRHLTVLHCCRRCRHTLVLSRHARLCGDLSRTCGRSVFRDCAPRWRDDHGQICGSRTTSQLQA